MKYWLFLFSIVFLVSGCQNYKKPPIATTENLFENRKKDGADELLNKITVLKIADAQRIALLNNPDYRSAAYSVNAATMAYYQALGAFSPTVSSSFTLGDDHSYVDSQYNSNNPSHGSSVYTNTQVNVNWVVFNGLSRYFNAKIAKSNESFQKALEADSERLLLSGVVYAYNEILLASENLRIAREDMKFQQESLLETELKHKVGTVPYSDVLNFKIGVNNAANAKLVSERQYALATYVLAVLMGYPEGKLPEWIKFEEISSSLKLNLPEVEVYLDTALANRPDLAGFREQLNIAKYTKYSSYSAFSPTVSLFGNFNYNSNDNRNRYGNLVSHSHSNGPGFEYGVTANWTIFNGLARMNRVRETQANYVVAEYRVAGQWLKIIEEVRSAYTNYIFSINQAKLYEETLLYSREQRDLVTKEYNAGTISITRLNDVQTELVNAEATLASAYINSKNAKVQLDTASGIISRNYYAHNKIGNEKDNQVFNVPENHVQIPVNGDGDVNDKDPVELGAEAKELINVTDKNIEEKVEK